MGKYLIEYTETAIKDLQKHKKSGDKDTLNKISKIGWNWSSIRIPESVNLNN